MRAAFGRITLNSSAAWAGALLLAHPAAAQDAGSVETYRLPDPNQTQAPRVQGPVDPDNPYSSPTRTPQPERSATPTPSPAPAPRINLPAPPREDVRATSRATPTPRATTAAPAPDESPSPARLPSSAEPAPRPVVDTLPSSSPAPAATSTDDAPLVLPAAPVESASDRTWWILGGAAAVVLAGGAFLLLRRRRSAATQDMEEAPPLAPVAEPVPLRPRPAPAPVATPPAAAPRSEPTVSEPFAIAATFKPQAIRLSLVYATLQYEIELTNAGATPLPSLVVRGDLMSAHASIPTAQQLAPLPEALEAKHELAALAPGESTTVKGEVRVPIQQIRPLVKGSASFLVPLARFCLVAPDRTFVRRVFTVGPRDAGNGAIASVRLDAGPRNLRELDAREIEAARGFVLDPVAAHG
ncbi:hypothetical protein HNO88_002893 [Novosphingobium chloroacetimidivorans]|uniref:LPXTG cell wall anchor domain-containing protein n=1 Tax=Novosphingobium chloroacetimidivorans TaxID=1428314 RepID=A0A7W7NXK6_9SPHN|nr:hypothetical protein [Novosphingobium chloroacetimidivorans]MBB4859564.1 hypothetical protein [Novosphingobium chloroacetimidivorans]